MIMLLLSAFAAAAFTASAYWPGLMTWDSVRQYGEALSGEITDWHPPTMQWVWRRLIAIHRGPAPVLLLQLALYWGGLSVLAGTFWRRGNRRLAWALLACGLLPLGLAITGMILKDSLMTGALLVATAMLALRGDRLIWWADAIAVAMLFFAATLRFNAFTACLPLLIAILPAAWSGTWPRLILTSVIGAISLMITMPVANRLIGAEPSGVELSLIVFDLGGITEFGGISVFPAELEVPGAVAVNHRCYRSDKWDSYSDWVAPECPLGYTAWNDNIDPHQQSPYAIWASAIAKHPVAYAQHRLHHFALNSRLLPLTDAVERPVPDHDAPNIWGFSVTSNARMRAIDTLVVATAHTPLGWPIVYMGLALGALIASWGLPQAGLAAPIALSALMYGCGYLVFSVAAELRYNLWTEIAALIAMTLVLGQAKPGRRRLGWAFGPAGVAAIAGIGFRMLA